MIKTHPYGVEEGEKDVLELGGKHTRKRYRDGAKRLVVYARMKRKAMKTRKARKARKEMKARKAWKARMARKARRAKKARLEKVISLLSL